MERLTRHFDESKNEDIELYDVRDIGLELLKTKRLSKIEDILEKYGIESLYELDKVLKIYRRLSDHDVIFNELKKYKDIEEDLGIDLITLFKAQKEGIWELAFNGYDEEIKPTYKPRKVTRHLCIDFKQKTLAEMWWRYDFSDYGKKELGGWALTKEELL